MCSRHRLACWHVPFFVIFVLVVVDWLSMQLGGAADADWHAVNYAPGCAHVRQAPIGMLVCLIKIPNELSFRAA